jgi:uncharacterized membrane protein YphA (DoxX/SURF4 family)
MRNQKVIEWVLRIAVAGEFLGHGMFALQQKASWVEYFTAVNISPDTALTLMTYIGILDMLVVLFVLFRPIKVVLLWAVIWTTVTSLARPVAGEPIWDLIERFANIGAPLALLLLLGIPSTLKGWFR